MGGGRAEQDVEGRARRGRGEAFAFPVKSWVYLCSLSWLEVVIGLFDRHLITESACERWAVFSQENFPPPAWESAEGLTAWLRQQRVRNIP